MYSKNNILYTVCLNSGRKKVYFNNHNNNNNNQLDIPDHREQRRKKRESEIRARIFCVFCA